METSGPFCVGSVSSGPSFCGLRHFLQAAKLRPTELYEEEFSCHFLIDAPF